MNRYLVQFREDTQQDFRTDCAFRDGQLCLAMQYVCTILDALAHVAEGRILDARTHTCVLRCSRM
jgi:hypothetical protein